MNPLRTRAIPWLLILGFILFDGAALRALIGVALALHAAASYAGPERYAEPALTKRTPAPRRRHRRL
ncbi:MAG: hypothetical protein HY078_13595 [Elusimicrobia bacterium]|nr:hypothetical protein [Elusimicrobiota bacterium]